MASGGPSGQAIGMVFGKRIGKAGRFAARDVDAELDDVAVRVLDIEGAQEGVIDGREPRHAGRLATAMQIGQRPQRSGDLLRTLPGGRAG